MIFHPARSGGIASLLLILLCGGSGRADGPAGPFIIGDHDRSRKLESPHPYPGSPDGKPRLVWSDAYAHAGASYIVVEFKKLDLAEGDWLEVRDPDRRQVHVYRGLGYKDKGGDFIAKMVVGPEVRLDLYSVHPAPKAYGYRIERVSRGYPTAMLESLPAPESLCGPDDRQDAACYAAAYPAEYQRARATARLVMDGVALCTAWTASCENHFLTNAHCTWDADQLFDSQEELDRMEVQFMAEAPCGGGTVLPASAFMGGMWIESDRALDYALFQAPAGEDPAAAFGHLVMETRDPVPDEPIYIPGHPGGGGKKIALRSTHPQDQSGFCEVAGVNETPCIAGATVPETGHYCDTEGGSSGSPVLSRTSQKVLALHHCGGCPNRAVPIAAVLARLQAGAHPLPACSVAADLRPDRTAYGCTGTAVLLVRDEGRWAEGAVAVLASSDTEPASEAISLAADAALSGRFTGTVPLTPDPPAAGDGRVSVAPGGRLTFRYTDAGGVERTADAAVDCAAPVITAVAVTGVTHAEALVGWATDEPSDGGAFFGFPPPPALYRAEAAGLRAQHAVQLDGLAPCSAYRVAVRAVDAAGNGTVDTAGGLYHRFTTLGAQYALPPEGAEATGGGWTVQGTSGSQWHPDACRPYFGTRAWKAGADAAQSCTAAYAPGSASDLVSPVFAPGPAGHGYRLRWMEWHDTEADPACAFDPLRVQISTDAGAAWSDLLAPYCGASGGWRRRDLDLSAYGGDAVRVRFRFVSDGLGQRLGWFIDGIEVARSVACSPPPPVPDGVSRAPGLRAGKLASDGVLALAYDPGCAAESINLLWGPLSGLAAYQLSGAECGLPLSGTAAWSVGPSTDLWFVLVGANGMGMESSWGTDGAGAERGGPAASGLCGTLVKNLSGSCP